MFRPSYVDPVTDRKEAFKFPLQCGFMRAFGSWPTADLATSSVSQRRFSQVYKLYSAIVIFLIFITCCAQSFFVFSKWGDLFTVTECGCTVFMGIHNLIRYSHLNRKRDTMRGIIQEFLHNIFVPKCVGVKMNLITCVLNIFLKSPGHDSRGLTLTVKDVGRLCA